MIANICRTSMNETNVDEENKNLVCILILLRNFYLEMKMLMKKTKTLCETDQKSIRKAAETKKKDRMKNCLITVKKSRPFSQFSANPVTWW